MQKRYVSTFLFCLVVIAGCGGPTAPPPVVAGPQFSPAAGTYSTTQSVTISDLTVGATIYYTTDGTAPSTLSTKYSGAIPVSNSTELQAIAVAPKSTQSAAVSAKYSIVPPVISATSFDFGQDLVNSVLTRTVGTITNGGPTAAPVTLSTSGDQSFTVVASQSCGSTIPAGASCPIVVAYDPTVAGSQSGAVTVGFTGGVTTPPLVALTGTSAVINAGTVTSTINPQVALYSIAPPFGATVSVQFGTTTAYGFETSSKATPANGGPVNILVAGMLGKTEYHIQATVAFTNGMKYVDTDHTFTTGAVPANLAPVIQVAQTAGMTPQPGIEMIDSICCKTRTAAIATDLAGNIIWTYSPPDLQNGTLLYPIKLLPNGDYIMEVNPVSQTIVSGPVRAGTLVVLREIDLAGNIVQQLSMDELNTRLTAAGFTGLNLQLFSHDVTLLPNGHMLVITNTFRPYTNVTGFPGTTNVVGDVVVDLDENMNPVWVWNEFDHFDVNRHPMGFPDWTHSNALIYSKDDGNFLISIRHQNWVVKVNYSNGTGDGSVVWKLGYQGDFTLQGGVDPTDWFYAQHNPSFFSSTTSGVFSLAVMDNGDDRAFPNGDNCQVKGGDLCYTSIPLMQIDETAKTATIGFHQVLPHSLYSSLAGNVEQLDNNNIEYNLAGVPGIGGDAYIFEVTQTASPETVWKMTLPGTTTYRAFRMGSLYPDVTW